jgi:hypothetical protein
VEVAAACTLAGRGGISCGLVVSARSSRAIEAAIWRAAIRTTRSSSDRNRPAVALWRQSIPRNLS